MREARIRSRGFWTAQKIPEGVRSRPLGPGMPDAYNRDMALAEETIRVSGIRCERCVGRLAAALEGHDGLESARANLMGDVMLAWDDERTSRDRILAALAKAGFRESAEAPAYGE